MLMRHASVRIVLVVQFHAISHNFTQFRAIVLTRGQFLGQSFGDIHITHSWNDCDSSASYSYTQALPKPVLWRHPCTRGIIGQSCGDIRACWQFLDQSCGDIYAHGLFLGKSCGDIYARGQFLGQSCGDIYAHGLFLGKSCGDIYARGQFLDQSCGDIYARGQFLGQSCGDIYARGLFLG